MSLRRWGRRIKPLSEKGSPRTIEKHIIRTIKGRDHEAKLHAMKGWRFRRA